MFEKIKAWVWDLHGMNCQQAIRLASRSMDEKLALKERFQLRCHFLLCEYCHHYHEHLHKIRSWLGKKPDAERGGNHQHMPLEVRERIAKALNKSH